MGEQKTPNSHNNPEKEKWGQRNQAPVLQIILQSYSHQNSMVFAKKKVEIWISGTGWKAQN